MTNKTDKPPVEVSAEAKAELVVSEASQNAVALFTSEKQYSDFRKKLEDAVGTHVPDLTTDKGRREIAAVAFRVTKAKTALDKAGLALTEGWRGQIKAVNSARFKMVEELDELAAKVRKPLTDWEAVEADRVAQVEECIQFLRNSAIVGEEETAESVEVRGRELVNYPLEEASFLDRLGEAQAAKDAAVLALLKARDRLRQEEADRAELERLRRENAEREERESAECERREAAEAEQRRKDEEARLAAEAEERRRAEIAEAEDRARREAKEAADRAAEALLAEERRKTAVAEEEAHKVREAEEARQREVERVAEEERARARNKARRKEVLDAAAADIAEAIGKNVPAAALKAASERVALAIAAGSVRNVSVSF